MLLTKILRSMAAQKEPVADEPVSVPVVPEGTGAPRVLNVGGSTKKIKIPSHFDGWDHLLLDIDPAGNPDVQCDARKLETLPAAQFDAVYCSHNFEHYYRHDGVKVLQGFLHVLKPGGFAEIIVPDISAVMRKVVAAKMDIEDVLYVSAAGPITVLDVVYGWSKEIEESGQDFYAHKTGFTPKSLTAALHAAGFPNMFVAATEATFEVRAVAFKGRPTAEQARLLGFAG